MWQWEACWTASPCTRMRSLSPGSVQHATWSASASQRPRWSKWHCVELVWRPRRNRIIAGVRKWCFAQCLLWLEQISRKCIVLKILCWNGYKVAVILLFTFTVAPPASTVCLSISRYFSGSCLSMLSFSTAFSTSRWSLWPACCLSRLIGSAKHIVAYCSMRNQRLTGFYKHVIPTNL